MPLAAPSGWLLHFPWYGCAHVEDGSETRRAMTAAVAAAATPFLGDFREHAQSREHDARTAEVGMEAAFLYPAPARPISIRDTMQMNEAARRGTPRAT